MKIKYIFFFCFFVLSTQIQSQTNYMTKKGHIKMVAKIEDKSVIVESHELSVYLDYITKHIKGTVDLRTLKNMIPELNSYLSDVEEPLLVQFSGTIPAEDFMSQPHKALTFNWLITVTFQNKKFDIIFRTTLQHVEEGTFYSCRLSAFGEIPTKKIGLKDFIPDLDETITIQFVQVILRVE